MYATSRPTIELARRERRSGNLPEVILWRMLRGRPGGFKFRRQHPVGRYVLDFACLSARWAIEIDGEVHGRGDRPQRDDARDTELAARGFRTLRFAASNVLNDTDAVIRAIIAACGEPLHHPAAPAGPPPRAGEVWSSL